MGNKNGRPKSLPPSVHIRRGSLSSTVSHATPWPDSMSSPHTYPPVSLLPVDYLQPPATHTRAKPFHKWERELLKSTFADLAARSAGGKSIDRETFLKFFSVPGMLGERLFAVFNRSGSGALDFDEFMSGLASYSRGTMEQKVQFLFRMCNIGNSGRISRAELETMCNNFVFAIAAESIGSAHLAPAAAADHDPSLMGAQGEMGAGGAPTASTLLTAHLQQMKNRAHSPSFQSSPRDDSSEIARAAHDSAEWRVEEVNEALHVDDLSIAVPESAPLPASSGGDTTGDAVLSSPAFSPLSIAESPLSPSPVREPDWLHATRVREMVDSAFEIGRGASAADGAAVAPSAAGAAAAGMGSATASPDDDGGSGLSIYQFGRWLQLHPEILEVLDAAFVGKEGLAYLDDPSMSGASALPPTNASISISARSSAIDLNDTIASAGVPAPRRFGSFIAPPPSLAMTPQHAPVSGGNSSPFHGGLSASSDISSMPLSAGISPELSALTAKNEEKATWKNGPRLSISGVTGPLLAPPSTRSTSSSLGARFAPHQTGAGGDASTHRMVSHQSCPPVHAAAYVHAPTSHFHCEQCGFDVAVRFCTGCGNPVTATPAAPAPGPSIASVAHHLPASASVSTASPHITTTSHHMPPAALTADHACAHCGTGVFCAAPPRFCPCCGFDSSAAAAAARSALAATALKPEPPLLKSLQWHRQHRGQASIEGYLKKVGARLKNIMSRWYVIRDNFLYTYNRPQDFTPTHVLFLEGCFVEAVNHEERSAKLKYGIEIIMAESRGSDEPRKSRFVYASSHASRQQWLECIRVHANVHDIEEFYTIGPELGVGRFSSVREGVSRASGKKYAIKIIDKSEVNEKEREALRTEVAVLRLVNHPYIIRLKNVFETRKQIFIVMSFVRGGDLFDRLVKRRRFSEATTQALMSRLLQVVLYLHERSIVHRDLKPENIMMVRENDDTQIVLADFGLGAFALPDQAMKLPCGTLTFTAPEVLIGKGYGLEVDIWSLGVLLFLLLRGSLPFDGRTAEEIRDKVVHARYSLDNHAVWGEVSNECKDLIRGLLTVDPAQRLTCQQAIDHPWFKLKLGQHANGAAASAAMASASQSQSATATDAAASLPLDVPSARPSIDSTITSTSSISGISPRAVQASAPLAAPPTTTLPPPPSAFRSISHLSSSPSPSLIDATSPLPPGRGAYDSSGASSINSSLTSSLAGSVAGSLTQPIAHASTLSGHSTATGTMSGAASHATTASAPLSHDADAPDSPPARIVHYSLDPDAVRIPSSCPSSSSSSPLAACVPAPIPHVSPHPHLMLSPSPASSARKLATGANARDSDEEEQPPRHMFGRGNSNEDGDE